MAIIAHNPPESYAYTKKARASFFRCTGGKSYLLFFAYSAAVSVSVSVSVSAVVSVSASEPVSVSLSASASLSS